MQQRLVTKITQLQGHGYLTSLNLPRKFPEIPANGSSDLGLHTVLQHIFLIFLTSLSDPP